MELLHPTYTGASLASVALRRTAHNMVIDGANNDAVDDVMKPLEARLEKVVKHIESLEGHKLAEEEVDAELRGIREVLGHIDAMYHEGRFHLPGVEGVPSGQGRAASLLTQAHELLRDRMEQRDDVNNISSDLRFFYNTLTNINHALDDLIANRPEEHTLKDLTPYRTRLAELDAHFQQLRSKARAAGKPPMEGENLIKPLISQAFEKIHSILLETDYYKIDPALHRLHDRLVHVIQGLEALKARGGRVTEEELQKYCTAMAKIEKHSHLGKFLVDGKEPEGQEVMAELVHTAHRHIHTISNAILDSQPIKDA